MYKHFAFCDETNKSNFEDIPENVLNELKESLSKIDMLKEQINQINLLIGDEKSKIYNNDWVQKKLNAQIPYIKEYIENINCILYNKFLN